MSKKKLKMQIVRRTKSILHAVETQDLIQLLRDAKIGETIPREDLDALACGDTRGSGDKHKYLKVARDYVFEHYNIKFTAVQLIGIRRMTSEEMQDKVDRNRENRNKNIRYDRHTIENCVDNSTLSPGRKTHRKAQMLSLKGQDIMSRTNVFHAQLEEVKNKTKRIALKSKEGHDYLKLLRQSLLEEDK